MSTTSPMPPRAADGRAALLALNQRLGAALTVLLYDLDRQRLHARAPAIDERPLAMVARHAYAGVVEAATAAAMGLWRDEATMDAPMATADVSAATTETVADLLAALDGMRARVDALIEGLDPGALDRELDLPWGERLSALDAIADALAHGFLHAGNIAGIRALAGFLTPAAED
jgi:hypothetical protein